MILLVFLVALLGLVKGESINKHKYYCRDYLANDLSPCLQKCIEPMAKLEKTISYLYRHYDDVCETLEKSAACSQKCSNEDHALFFQYTTFYRVHCIEMEEGLVDILILSVAFL